MALVSVCKSLCDLRAISGDAFRRQRLSTDTLTQRMAFYQLHSDVHMPFRFPYFENRADVRVCEGSCRAGFTDQPGTSRGVGGKGFGKDFQRDVALEPWIMSPIHLAHAACAENADDLVRSHTASLHDP